jgi:putative endonuclease
MDYFVYIMASKRNGTLYVGVTNDLLRRVYEHKNNRVEGFSSTYDVHSLVWFESTASIGLQSPGKSSSRIGNGNGKSR